jgi:hypothetical protein
VAFALAALMFVLAPCLLAEELEEPLKINQDMVDDVQRIPALETGAHALFASAILGTALVIAVRSLIGMVEASQLERIDEQYLMPRVAPRE